MQTVDRETALPYRVNSDPLVPEIVRRILTVEPEATITLFGSRARGLARPDSDYDLLVIVPYLNRDRSPTGHIRWALRGIAASFDLLAMTPDEWRDEFTMAGSVVYEIARDGKKLHG